MKRIIFFIPLLISVGVFAQDKPSYTIGLPGQTSHARGNLRVDSTFLNPLRDTTFTPWRLGLQIFRPADSSLYVSTSLTASQKWTRLGSGSAVGDSSIFATRYWTNTQLATKQNSLTTGTTDEYFRGDLSLSNFSSDVTAIGDALYAPISHTHIFSDISDGTDAVRNLFSAGSGITYNPSTGVIAATGSMVYPGAGIPVSTGSAWGTSLSNTTVGTNFLTATNPGAAGYYRTNADNTITHRTYAQVLSDLGITNANPTLNNVLTNGNTTSLNIVTTGDIVQGSETHQIEIGDVGNNWNGSMITVGGTTPEGILTGNWSLTAGRSFKFNGSTSGTITFSPHEVSGTSTVMLPKTGNSVDTMATLHDVRAGGGSVVHQNLSNTALLANGDYTSWWSSYRLKIVGFDQLDLHSDTVSNGNFGIADWKTSKGLYIYGNKSATAGSYAGPKDSFFVAESFNADSLSNIKVYPGHIDFNQNGKKLTLPNISITNDSLVAASQVAEMDLTGAQTGMAAVIDMSDTTISFAPKVDTIYRTAGIDSIFFKISGVTYKIKDSVGTGGGASNYDSLQVLSSISDLETATGNAAVVDGRLWIKYNSTSWKRQAVDSTVTFSGTVADLDFSGGEITESPTDVWSPVAPNGSYGHRGLGTLHLASGTDGAIYATIDQAVDNTDGDGYMLGWDATNALTSYTGMEIAVRPVVGTGYGVFLNNSFQGYQGTCADGDVFRIRIDRTASKAIVERSTNGGASFSTVYEATSFSYTNLYPVVDIHGTSKINNPQREGLIP